MATALAVKTPTSLGDTHARVLAATRELRVLDLAVARTLILDRQQLGLDKHDEVWDGVYVMAPLPTNPHQGLVTVLTVILFNVVDLEGRGKVLAGANVSDRASGWEENFRGPDVVVTLKGSKAVDCETHWMGGPDFLIEVQSPRDDTEKKVPFYGQIGVRELLIIQRDSRELRLLRHDGQGLAEVEPVAEGRKRWLVSEVVPLAFRRTGGKAPRTEVRRTDGKPGSWTV
jgi:Uma2 family endonuclease